MMSGRMPQWVVEGVCRMIFGAAGSSDDFLGCSKMVNSPGVADADQPGQLVLVHQAVEALDQVRVIQRMKPSVSSP